MSNTNRTANMHNRMKCQPTNRKDQRKREKEKKNKKNSQGDANMSKNFFTM